MFYLVCAIIGAICLQLSRVILQELKNKREYDRGFKDGVEMSVFPLKSANKQLESFTRENENQELLITLILNGRK